MTFSHLDAGGRAHMVDTSNKEVTKRLATASCFVELQEETLAHLTNLPKGDAVTVARIAGIAAAKRTAELIPLAHPLALEHVAVEISPEEGGVRVRSQVTVVARTGAEMEALAACAVAALALYDMVKASDRAARITDLVLDSKSGGKSGDYRRGARP